MYNKLLNYAWPTFSGSPNINFAKNKKYQLLEKGYLLKEVERKFYKYLFILGYVFLKH